MIGAREVGVGWRGALLGAIAIGAGAAIWLHGPITQPQDYHQFADQRRLLGVANMFNVLSNLAFVIVGVLGLQQLARRPPGLLDGLRPAAVGFFAGAVLIGLGSGWYHLAPDDARLVWDRAPMTIAFMSLVALVVGEQVDVELGRRLLWPLVALGLGSVAYWAGTGDLRIYVLVQFLPMLLLPLLLVLYPSPLTPRWPLGTLIAAYVLAKVFELGDVWLLERVGVSGHTFKHLAAAGAMAMLVVAIRGRRPRAP